MIPHYNWYAPKEANHDLTVGEGHSGRRQAELGALGVMLVGIDLCGKLEPGSVVMVKVNLLSHLSTVPHIDIRTNPCLGVGV